MADRPPPDLLIKNVRLARPGHHTVETRDLGIADGRFTRVEPAIDAALARAVVTGGVTTVLTYFRTGQYYLDRGGPYVEFGSPPAWRASSAWS